MKARELLKIGYPQGPILGMARAAAGVARVSGKTARQVRSILEQLLREPAHFSEDPIFGALAAELLAQGIQPKTLPTLFSTMDYRRAEELTYQVWGQDIDADAHQQMRNACRLPISVAGALMPDAHVGYGLPIG
ncbi:MAG TPA: RtcB family protein, partial [Phycisphaerae bacterium]|nr:RtcB family protein [Phycisphaerae bacterium]